MSRRHRARSGSMQVRSTPPDRARHVPGALALALTGAAAVAFLVAGLPVGTGRSDSANDPPTLPVGALDLGSSWNTSGPPPAVQIYHFGTTAGFLIAGETSDVCAHVVDAEFDDLDGAEVRFSADRGTLRPVAGVSADGGVACTSYDPPKVPGRVRLSVVAEWQGYTTAVRQKEVDVLAPVTGNPELLDTGHAEHPGPVIFSGPNAGIAGIGIVFLMGAALIAPATVKQPVGRSWGRRLHAIAGSLSLAAGTVHLALIPAHWPVSWIIGAFFLVTGIVQIAYAAILGGRLWERSPFRGILGSARRRETGVYVAGIAGNLGLVALYAVTRTIGLPAVGGTIGLGQGVFDLAHPRTVIALHTTSGLTQATGLVSAAVEPFDLLGFLTTLAEIVAVAFLVTLLRRARSAERTGNGARPAIRRVIAHRHGREFRD